MSNGPPPEPTVEALLRERAALEGEVARLRQALAESRRSGERGEEARRAEALGHAGALAANTARTEAAEVDAKAAWKRAAEIGASMGRRIAEGQARLLASQAAVTALERSSEGLSALRAAAVLREADLRTVIESAIDCAIITTDRDGLVLAWNSGARGLLGWDEDAALAMDLHAALAPEDAAGNDGLLADAQAALDGERVSREGWLRRQDGSRVWAGIEAMALRAGEGEAAAGVLWMLRDRGATRRAESALREREERLAGVLDGMAEGFGVLAPDFTILEHNREALRMDGRRLEEIIGRSHWEVYPGSEDSELGRLLKHAMAARVPVTLEHRYAWESGHALWLEMRAHPTPDGALAVFWRDVTDRKAAEAALREQEAKYRTLFDSIDEGYCVIEMMFDAEGRPEDYVFVEVNGAFARQTGLADALGRRMRELAPDHEAHWFEIYGRIARTGVPERFEQRAEALGRWYDVYAFRIGPPEANRVAVLFNDVTQRRQADAALRTSEERFRNFAENSTDVLWIADGQGQRLEYLSPAFERMFGEPGERVLADIGRWLELVHPEDRAGASAAMPRSLAGERVVAQYRVIRPADGRIVHLRDTGFPMYDASGAVAHVGGITQDVSDMVMATRAVETEKERLRTLAEGLPQLVWRAEAGGRWSWASPQWTGYTGMPDAASRALGWLEAVHPDDRAAVRAAWERAAASVVVEVECRLRRGADGAWRWFQMRGTRGPRAGPGRVEEWFGAFTDIDDAMRAREALARGAEELEARVAERTAELMAAEETLRQAQKMEAIGQLTGGIAHDFNNMLQGVVGALGLAQRRLRDGRTGEVERYIVAAGDAAERAAGLTRRLLAFARRQRLDPRPVEADSLLTGMAEMLRRTVGPSITLDLRLRDGAGAVLCDPNELEGAVLNLCINARDAMPQGGVLAIATRDVRLEASDLRADDTAEPGAFVEIGVRDTGEGMAPEVLERALEPFFTTKPQGHGTGLGLSQVYGFARQSGGVLRIESEAGRGTTVRLVLPRRAEDGGEAAGEGEVRAVWAVTGAKVLMVDDETAVRVPAAEHLRDLGYRVVEAQDGPAALALLEGGLRPDLLVSDVGLPNGMDGASLAEAVRARVPEVRVLFITGYARVALPEDAEVMTKPFDLDELATRVATILADLRPG